MGNCLSSLADDSEANSTDIDAQVVNRAHSDSATKGSSSAPPIVRTSFMSAHPNSVSPEIVPARGTVSLTSPMRSSPAPTNTNALDADNHRMTISVEQPATATSSSYAPNHLVAAIQAQHHGNSISFQQDSPASGVSRNEHSPHPTASISRVNLQHHNSDGGTESGSGSISTSPRLGSSSTSASTSASVELTSYLAKVPLLSKLSADERTQLASALTPQSFHTGDVIVNEGDDGSVFYLIREGEARVSKRNASTGTQTDLCVLKASDYFGEQALVHNAKRMATVTAITSPLLLLTMEREKFNAMFGSDKLSVNFVKRAAVSAEVVRVDDETGRVRTSFLGANRSMSERVKTDSQRSMLLSAVERNILFDHLTPSQRSAVVDCMWLEPVDTGTTIIKQGDTGSSFYVVESGVFDIFVRPVPVPNSPSSRPTTSSSSPSSPNAEPVKVATRGYAESFGELALLYNAPRAATVISRQDSAVFVLSRQDFRAIVEKSNRDKLAEYERFLQKVTSFEALLDYERAKIAEALEEITYPAKACIVRQNEPGDTFFILASGEVRCTIKNEAGHEVEVARYSPGDYFGERALVVANEKRAATLTAIGPVRCLYLNREAFSLLLGPMEDIFKRRVRGYSTPLAEMDLSSSASSPVAASHSLASLSSAAPASQMPHAPVTHSSRAVQAPAPVPMDLDEPPIAASSKTHALPSSVSDASTSSSALPPSAAVSTASMVPSVTFSAAVRPLNQAISSSSAPPSLAASPIAPTTTLSAAGVHVRGSSHADGVTISPTIARFSLSEFKIIGTLGRGSFGHVQLVRHYLTSKVYALKTVSKASVVRLGQQQHMIDERATMLALNSPHLIRLYGTFQDRHAIFFVLEPSLGGELFSILRARSLFDENTARFYAAGVVCAFDYMHSKGIIYRDLKPENLLLDARGYLKITDFGFAKQIGDGRTWTLCGTPDYLAPEVVGSHGHGKGVDWWCLGVLLFEMLASYPPFYSEDPMHTYAKIMRGSISFPSHFSRAATDLIARLLHPKATKRLGVISGGANNVMNHPFFDSFDWTSFHAGEMKAPIIPKIKSEIDLSNFERYPDENKIEPYFPVPQTKDWTESF